eukprot:COSAG01_NODE_623_length_14742_cov_22.391177_4_plen_164_part_00
MRNNTLANMARTVCCLQIARVMHLAVCTPVWRVIHERCWHGMGRRHPSGGQLQIWISTPQTAAADGHHFARADPASLGDLIAMAGPSARLAACGPQITFLPDEAGRVVALGVDRFKDPSCVCCHQCKRLHVSAKCNVHQCPAGEARPTPSPARAAPASHPGLC